MIKLYEPKVIILNGNIALISRRDLKIKRLNFIRSNAVDSPTEKTSRFQGFKRTVIDRVFRYSNSREIGKGVVGKKRDYRVERMNTEVKDQIDDIDDHRYVLIIRKFTMHILPAYFMLINNHI